jgi:DNA (cytosine-5)-methyltransferase 3A
MKLLIGGSPCTHWSIAQTKNRETEASGIGWELFLNYRIARDKYQPDFFLYENNKSMSPAIRAQITAELGVEPALINSALVSAQNRQRLYWAGKRNQDGTYSQVAVEQPVDRGILLRDILESGVCWREKAYTLKANYANAGAVNGVDGGHFPATMAAEPVRIGTIENDAKNQAFDSQQYRVYSPDGKAVTLCGNGGGLGAKTGLYAVPVPEPVNETVDGKAQCLRATYYKDGIRNLVGNTVDRKTCVAIPVPAAGRIVGRRINEQGHRDDYNEAIPHFQYFEVNEEPQKTNCLTTVQKDNMIAVPVRVGAMPNKDGELGTSQSRRIYSTDGKSVSLQARPNGGGADGAATGLYAVPAGMAWRGRENGSAFEMRDDQKSNAVAATGHQSRLVIEAADGKQMPVYEVRGGRITIKGKTYPIKLADGFYIIRKLTVTECKRLQTVPDTYAFPVSDTQAYKMLGNGWTVDVIAHIMSHFTGLTEEPVEVLSMYDGMSCGHIALDKLGAEITAYYATEIDKYAVQTTQHNYPDTMQLGDAFQVRDDDWRLGEEL